MLLNVIFDLMVYNIILTPQLPVAINRLQILSSSEVPYQNKFKSSKSTTYKHKLGM